MKNQSNLGVKIAVALVSVVGGALIAVLLLVTATLHTELEAYSATEGQQIASARADQVGTLIRLVEYQLRTLADRAEIRTGNPVADQKKLAAVQDLLPPEILQLLWADPAGNYSTSKGPSSASLSDRAYFKEIISQGKAYVVSEPVVSKSLGIPIVVIAVPVYGNQGVVGLLGGMMSLETFSQVAAKIKVGYTGYGWVIDKTGLMLAYPVAAEVMKRNVTDSDKDGYQGLDALGRQMVLGKPGWGQFKKPDGRSFATYFCPIPESPGWTLGLSLPLEEAQATETDIRNSLLVVLAVAVILALALAVVIGRQLSRPLMAAARQFQELSRADADLTVQLPVARDDEIGRMIGDFNRFVAKLRALIRGLKDAQQQLSGIGVELGHSVRSSQTAVGDIGTSVGIIRDQSSRQSRSVVQSSSAVEEIAKNIESLDGLIHQQAASITEGSASVEQMVGNIGAIRDSAEKMSGQFDELSQVIGQVHQAQTLAMGKIQSMSEQSEGLLEANRMIAHISSQTNLLAMNAAIEAAHAGDAGRGFSVVADEIRKLAETSAAESKSIGKELKAIQTSIGEILTASRDSESAFTQVDAQILQTEAIVRGVKEALTEQQEGSHQMLLALHDMNHVTAEVQGGSQEMRVGNKTILEEIQVLKEGTAAIAATLEQVETETTAVSQSSDLVDALTTRTGTIIAEMEGLIGRFRV